MPRFVCRNLACSSDRSLQRISANKSDPRWRVAWWMLRARKLRLAGNIDAYLSVERRIDRLLSQVPEDLRW